MREMGQDIGELEAAPDHFLLLELSKMCGDSLE